jgi:uncharacterized membrane protein (DUF2068 family)
MSDFPTQHISGSHNRHNRWLDLIAAYKLLQALLFVAIGVGALHLLHQDINDVLSRVADHLRFNPESRFVNFVIDKASFLDDPLLRRIGALAFSYAAIGLAEGIGLYLEQAWAEYLTLVITGSFLPWEVFEIVRRVTWVRTSLLVINLLVFLYLLKLVIQRGRSRKAAASVTE